MLNGVIDISGSLQNTLIILELTCAVIILLLNITMLILDQKKEKRFTFLNLVLVCVPVVLITDVGAQFFRGNEGAFAFFAVRAVNFLYFVACNMAAWAVVRHSLQVIEQHGVKPYKWIAFFSDVLMAITLLSLILNIFFGFFFYIDESNLYNRGPIFLLSQIPSAIFILVLLFLIIRYHKTTTTSEKVAMLSYVVLPVLAEVVQVFSYGFSWLPISMAVSAFLVILQQFFFLPRKEEAENRYIRTGRALRNRVLIFVFVFIIIFFSITARIAIDFASNRLDDEIEQHYGVLTEKTAEEISFWIEEEAQTVKNHKVAIEIMNDFSKETLRPYLEKIVQDYNPGGYIYDLYFTTPENVMYSGYGFEEPNIDFTQREWYVNAVNSDEICYSDPYLDSYTDKFVVTISTNVKNREDELMGVLALDMFVDKIFEIAENQEVPDDSYLFLVDEDFCIMTHKNAEWDYRSGGSLNLSTLEDDNYSKLYSFILEENPSTRYISFTDYDDVGRCFFTCKLDNCNWYIIAAISKSVIDRPKQTLSESIFLSLLVCLVLGVLVTLLATNQIMRKLAHAQQKAKEASEAKSRFLANMSHEIRTPINAVLGMDEILLRECEDDKLKEYALNIQSSGQALLGIVNDILDFSKIESNKMDIVPVKYSLAEMIGNCTNMIEMRAKEKCLAFKVERDDYLPSQLYGDEVRIRQIIINLLTNAVKYTPEGSVTLFVGWKKTAEQEGSLMIRVSDTGMGISKEGLQELFTSFQRLDEKKNRNIEGTGLGLAITKQLVDLMGGTITVASEYQKGSTFTVEIPQPIEDATNLTSLSLTAKTTNQRTSAAMRTRDAKILVVDDVLMNLRVVQGLLKGTDLAIVSVQSGREALEQIERDHFDIIFLDHMMPEMDGIETFKKMQESYPEVAAKTPVIMLTANAISGAMEEYLELGFSGYLSKPVSRDSLQKCLKEFLPPEKIVEF